METDFEIISRLMEQYSKAATDDDRITILEDLEYLVHQLDNAVNFVDMGKLYDHLLTLVSNITVIVIINILYKGTFVSISKMSLAA